MASGSFTSNTGTQLNMYVTWSSTTNVSGNYSTVTMKVYLKHYSLYAISRSNSTMVCNGTTYTYTSPAINYSGSSYTSTLLGSHSFTVAHNADGTKTGVVLRATWQFDGTYGTTSIGTISASATVNLDTIPRASSISVSYSSINVGAVQTISISRASSSFTHTITYKIGSTTGTVTTKTTSTSVTWTIPTSFYSLMPSSTSGYVTLTCTTYNGDTAIGTSTKSFTAVVPSTIVPSIGSISSAIGGNSVTIGWATYVQGKSKTTISVSGCAAGTGSQIKSYKFSGNNLSSTVTSSSASANATSGYLTSSGTLTYTVTITDTRGRTASKSVSIMSYAYSAPTFKNISAFRSDSSGNQMDAGTYVKCSYSANYSSCNGKNAISYTPQYKLSSDTTWSTLSLNASTGISTSGIFSTSSSYQVRCIVTDSLGGTSTSNIVVINTQSRLLNIKADGTGIGVGKMAEVSKLFDCEYDARFRNALTLDGKVKAQYLPTLLCTLGTSIAAGADLNTTTYLTPGNYCCTSSVTASGFTNCPTSVAFKMTVYDCLGQHTDVVGSTYVYIIREITNLYGDKWIQNVISGSTAGAFTYSSWYRVLSTYNTNNYVVSEGTSDFWTYRKWSNGRAECWGHPAVISEIACLTATSDGSCYYNSSLSNVSVSLPSGLFTSVEHVTVSAVSSGYINSCIGAFSTSSVQYRLFSSYPTTHKGVYVMLNVIGKYK